MKFVLFADDTNILCKHDNYFSLCDLVNMELSTLSKWFSVNKVSLKSYMLVIDMPMIIYKFVLIGKNEKKYMLQHFRGLHR